MANNFNICDQNLLVADRIAPGEEVYDRHFVSSSAILSTTGELRLVYFTARKTEPVTQVRTISGGTAAGATPTVCRVGIYTEDASGNLTLAGSIANDTTLWATQNTAYTSTLSAGFTKTAGQRYAVGLLVVTGATAPTYQGMGASLLAGESSQAPRISARFTGQTDLPGSVAVGSLATSPSMPYAVLL